MVNELSQALYGEGEMTVDELRTWFEMPDLVMLVAESADGRIVGYADLVDHGLEHLRYQIDFRVAPGHDDSAAVADALVAEMEARSAETAVAGASTRIYVPSPYELGHRLAGERGYEPFRHSFQMRIDFEGELPEPVWPEGVSVREFVRGQDDEAVYEAQDEAFSDHFEHARWPYENWVQWAFPESFDPSLWFVAVDGGDIAGVCLCRPEGQAGPDVGWVNVLGVRRAWRRRGVARALLLHAFAEFRARRKHGAGLGVDGLNLTGAVALYEGTGMHVARRFDQYLKPLTT